ncbi:heme lyase CcmF/NrfE family subunit [Metapseudomonas sp. CR1201]
MSGKTLMMPSKRRLFSCFAPVLLLSAIALWLFPSAGNWAIWGTVAIIVMGTINHALRAHLWVIALAMLVGTCIALMAHLLADHFDLRYVWLYSSASLPAYLKASNLWGGDEGTVLLLATFIMACAVRFMSLPGWSGIGTALIAAWYTGYAAWLAPFTGTPADWLSAQASQGMNAHLQTFWMALHAPLILAAYAWAIAPAGAAIDALRGANTYYRQYAVIYGRRSWLVLTAGIGFGMVWALEDFTFGHIWHWDPVQTCAFAVWALLGAVLHGARRWKPGGKLWRLLPALSVLAAVVTCIAMAVTRSEVLPSSHRYIGTTSWLSHLGLAGILSCLLLWGLWRSLQGRQTSNGKGGDWTLTGAIYLFVGAAVLASLGLAQAHIFEWIGLEKDVALKPFYETLTTWASGTELAGLRKAFDQWDIDGHELGRRMLPVIAFIGLLGGHSFIRKCVRPRIAIGISLLMAIFTVAMGTSGGWLTDQYSGQGILSQSVVRTLPWLDAALFSGLYLLVACLGWCALSVWRNRRLATLRHTGSLVLIHAGAVIALVGGLSATALNSYVPLSLSLAASPEDWHQVSNKLQVRVLPLSDQEDNSGYRAVAQVELRADGTVHGGHALFQDARQLPPAYQGPVRQLCEILDYRYARYAGDPGYVLHPFILRSWDQDLQVWIPATSRLMVGASKASATGEVQSLVVIRRFPLVSFVWAGLIAMVLGTLLLPNVGLSARR